MGIIAMKVLAMWFLVSFVTGLAVGATIGKSNRFRRDEFLTDLFSTLETEHRSSQLIHKAM
jgi:hypothetical protein